jgi:hypothetical protein
MTEQADGEPGKQPASIRKIEANRQNALKSTGPKTPRGKAYSRRNAIKHGLFAREQVDFNLLGESSKEYDELLNDLIDAYEPVGRAEELEVERIALCWWKLKRVSRHENSVTRIAVRHVSKEELARQEYCRTLDKLEDAIILGLENAKNEMEATGDVPQGFKERIFAIRPGLEAFWPIIERAAEDGLKKLDVSKMYEELSPDEQSSSLEWFTVVCAIAFFKEMRKVRTTGVMEVAVAQHLIPDRNDLDRILRYETAIERNLGRALDRLERLQRRRRGEPVLPPVSVRLTQ